MSILSKLSDIQSAYKIGKDKHNVFGNFDYRNIEDMLTALRPLLKKNACALYFSEKIEMVADRIYVVSTATIVDSETNGSFSSTAYAREPLTKKGMDESQITGSTTSYARKYALSGLLSVNLPLRMMYSGSSWAKTAKVNAAIAMSKTLLYFPIFTIFQ